jgi:4'-phosphopantetheinyl transferase EntD
MVKMDGDSIIARLFPATIVTEEAEPGAIEGPIYPEEEKLMARSVPKRRQEFIAGRLCARRALERLGVRRFPILMGRDREPLWPGGIVGAISHTRGYCGVAVARTTDLRSLGLDVQYIDEVSTDCLEQVCTPQELLWIESLPRSDRKRSAALIFSAKECLYKCQHAVSKKWLGFKDVNITADDRTSEFGATFLIEQHVHFPMGTTLKGRYIFRDHLVFTGMVLTMLDDDGAL